MLKMSTWQKEEASQKMVAAVCGETVSPAFRDRLNMKMSRSPRSRACTRPALRVRVTERSFLAMASVRFSMKRLPLPGNTSFRAPCPV